MTDLATDNDNAEQKSEAQVKPSFDDVKIEDLIAVGDEMTNVLKLEPAISTVLTLPPKTKAKAKQEAQAEFRATLISEIIEVLTGKDTESGVYFVEAGDIPRFKEETRSIIKLLVPQEAGRLFPPQAPERPAASGKKSAGGGRKPGKAPAAPKAVRYTRADAAAVAMVNKPGASVEILSAEADSIYRDKTGSSPNPREAKAWVLFLAKSLSALANSGYTITAPSASISLVEPTTTE